MSKSYKRYIVIKIIGFFLVFVAGGALLIMLLWNNLITGILPIAKEINFLQALGVLLLGRILSGGTFAPWRNGNCCCGNSYGHKYKGWWRKRYEEKLASMTPEEKEKLKEAYKKCCGIDEEQKDK